VQCNRAGGSHSLHKGSEADFCGVTVWKKLWSRRFSARFRNLARQWTQESAEI